MGPRGHAEGTELQAESYRAITRVPGPFILWQRGASPGTANSARAIGNDKRAWFLLALLNSQHFALLEQGPGETDTS